MKNTQYGNSNYTNWYSCEECCFFSWPDGLRCAVLDGLLSAAPPPPRGAAREPSGHACAASRSPPGCTSDRTPRPIPRPSSYCHCCSSCCSLACGFSLSPRCGHYASSDTPQNKKCVFLLFFFALRRSRYFISLLVFLFPCSVNRYHINQTC